LVWFGYLPEEAADACWERPTIRKKHNLILNYNMYSSWFKKYEY
jgi:hypothetical protein